MTDFVDFLPAEQRRVRAGCRHTFGSFIAFPADAIELSIPVRFEHVVDLYPSTGSPSLSRRSMAVDSASTFPMPTRWLCLLCTRPCGSGVDVECGSILCKVDQIARRFFSTGERADLASVPQERMAAFYA